MTNLDRSVAMREALAEKVRKDIACTRTYTMKEWAIIEASLYAPRLEVSKPDWSGFDNSSEVAPRGSL